jgi:CBS domain-containing protein
MGLLIEIIMVLYILLLIVLFYLYLGTVGIRLQSKNFLTHFKIPYNKLMQKRQVATAKPTTGLKEIFEIMCNWNGRPIGSVVVVDAANKPIGIITYKDIERIICRKPESFSEAKAADIMTDAVVTFSQKELKDQAVFRRALEDVKVMKINHIVVVDAQDKLKNIFTTKDIFRIMEPGYGVLSG